MTLAADSRVDRSAPEAPQGLELRAAPAGLPAADLEPPVVAETGDPFSALRVVELLARVPRGRPIRIDELVAALNARHLGWLFEPRVVTSVLLQLQSNWLVDYRNSDGIVVEDGPLGPALALEDSSRVDPWIVAQAMRLRAACEAELREFSRRDRVTGE
jgi:hypothetical protein